jgi:hypothetical protein
MVCVVEADVLTLKRCREILGKDCTLTDEELEMLRDQLYVIADMALDAYHATREPGDPTHLAGAETAGSA